MNVEMIPIKSLVPYERNPRSISSDALAKLCDSLERDPDFMQIRPLLVYYDGDKYIVYAGNQRLRAAKKLRWKEMPCLVDRSDDAELIKSRMLKDNLSLGEWDFEILANDFEPADLLLAGFDAEDLHLDKEDEPARMPPEDKPTECPICGAVF